MKIDQRGLAILLDEANTLSNKATWTPQDCVTSSSTCTHYLHDLAYSLYDFSVDGKKIEQASVQVSGPLAVSVNGAGTITQVAGPFSFRIGVANQA